MSATTKKFIKEGHAIYWGDVVQVLSNYVDDESVDLIFVDPPYNIGKSFDGLLDRWPSDDAYVKWCYSWLTMCIAKLSPSGSMYLMTSTQAMPHLDLFVRNHMHVLSRIVWSYDSSGVQARKYFGSMYEPILFCVKNKKDYVFNSDAIKIEAKTGAQRKLIDYRKKTPTVYNSQKVPGNVWYFPRVRYRMEEYEEHPSQKPVTLLERIIRASSNPGDTILDPFAGTFTTGAVAKKLNRRSISIELQESYIKIGLRRLSLLESFNGEALIPLSKTFLHKNSKSLTTVTNHPTLFDV